MFNNSTRKHSFWKVATEKKIIPSKKNWEVHKRKLEIIGKSQILDLAAILTLNDLYYIMG